MLTARPKMADARVTHWHSERFSCPKLFERLKCLFNSCGAFRNFLNVKSLNILSCGRVEFYEIDGYVVMMIFDLVLDYIPLIYYRSFVDIINLRNVLVRKVLSQSNVWKLFKIRFEKHENNFFAEHTLVNLR